MTLRQHVELFFRDHPNEWIDAGMLASLGGRFAWRTRVSECRRGGMTIENHTRRERNVHGDWFTVSEYRYVPSVVETTPAMAIVAA